MTTKLLELPALKDKEKAPEKRFSTDPDLSVLKGQQSIIFKQLQAFINSPEEGRYLVQGYAGTGKTYLISVLTEWLLSAKNKSVAMTAPTNKAVKVLKDFAQYQDVNLEYRTIHSLLRLRHTVDGFGNERFVQDNTQDCSVDEYDVVIVDEASMISDELLEGNKYMRGLFFHSKVKVIFVGDPAQIPPIGKENSLPFTEEGRRKHKVKVGMLTEIIRQAKGNPIINTTLKIREVLGRSISLPLREDEFTEDGDGVYFVEKDGVLDDILNTFFTSDNFAQDSDFAKVIAWTNKCVDGLNSKIRKMIYGEYVDRIMLGEKLIADRPIINRDDKSIIFTTNDEFEVVGLHTVDGEYRGIELKYYEAEVLMQGVYSEVIKTIKIIHPDSDKDFATLMEYLKDAALAEKKGTFQAADKWKEFYMLKQIFATVKYNYAITAHKSQGSTYRNAIVIESDIDYNRKVIERNRIKYTACTRPSHKLIIV